MTAQDCALLIGAVAAGVATCLGAVGGLWVQMGRQHAEVRSQIQQVAEAVNGGKETGTITDRRPA
jgi:hypothetical protein